MSSPNGLIPSEISSRVREFKPELNAWPSAMLAMLSLLARVFPSYESILAPDIGFISRSEDVELIILLAGGDKSTQAKDIKAALRLARNLSE